MTPYQLTGAYCFRFVAICPSVCQSISPHNCPQTLTFPVTLNLIRVQCSCLMYILQTESVMTLTQWAQMTLQGHAVSQTNHVLRWSSVVTLSLFSQLQQWDAARPRGAQGGGEHLYSFLYHRAGSKRWLHTLASFTGRVWRGRNKEGGI